MVIQELKPSQRVQGRWLAMLEDGSILRVGQQEIADFALYSGRELTEEETEALTAGLRRRQLRERALELLSRKPQSRRELTRKLNEWGAQPEEADAVCDRMEELGYLNEADYAAQIVRVYSARGFGERSCGTSCIAGVSPGTIGMTPWPRWRTPPRPSTPFWKRNWRGGRGTGSSCKRSPPPWPAGASPGQTSGTPWPGMRPGST